METINEHQAILAMSLKVYLKQYNNINCRSQTGRIKAQFTSNLLTPPILPSHDLRTSGPNAPKEAA